MTTQFPGYKPPRQPRRRWYRRHPIRAGLGGVAAVLVVLGVIGAATGSSHPVRHAATRPAPDASASSAQAAIQSQIASEAAASPTPAAVTTIKFVITGYAPGDGYGNGPTISYGSNTDTHEAAPGAINGKLTFTVPFDPAASYYSVDAQLAGTGHLTCKIIADGPYPDVPTVVSHGSTSGGYGICSAQAAPQDPAGATWTDEQ